MATTESDRPSSRRASKGARDAELREALTHVGELMQLPPKLPGVAEAGAKAARAARATKAFSVPSPTGAKLWLPIVAAALAVGVAAATFWPAAPPTVPQALQRDWATLNPKYVKNRIAFTDTEVRLTAASGTTTSHRIANISTEMKGDSMMILLNYEEAGGLTELGAALVSVPTPRLVFTRPQGLVWEAVVQ